MSRIGKQPIPIPKGAKVELKDGVLVAEGPKGRVEEKVFEECPITIEDGEIKVSRSGDGVAVRAKHGLLRSLINNAVVGVTEGFTKHLEIVGVGYRGETKGKELHLALGYSHPVVYPIPDGIDIQVEKARMSVSGANRQKVGQVAAEIRSLRPPDPYKAKGIRYSDEVIRRKVGKAGAR
jgi:large subunit ribosomal protein L6